MTASAYRKPQAVVRNIGNKTLVGAGEIRIPLNKDNLTTEHMINVLFTQVFAIAPTAMGDLSQVIKSVVIESDKGPLVNSDGMSMVALSSLTEKQPNQRKVVGLNSSGNLFFDVHYENDGAVQDLLTALETGGFSGLDLVITLVDPFVAGVYTGGGTPSALNFNVRVNAKTLPELTGIGAVDAFDSTDPQTGEAIVEANQYAGVGTAFHRVGTQVIRGVTTGDQQPVRLQAKAALVRFLQMLSLDTTGANPAVSDNIIEDARLVVNGNQVFHASFSEIQAANESRRNVNRLNSGIGVIDFGDDETGFLDMPEGNEALLYLRIASSAPTGWEVRMTEDYTTES